MQEEGFDRRRRFARVARRVDESDGENARENFLDSLDAITVFLGHAAAGGREAFVRNSPAYASGSMAIIRTAALFETDDFADFLRNVPDAVAQGIITTRNIAAHSGYRSMDDDIFWNTLTIHLPPYLDAWRTSAQH